MVNRSVRAAAKKNIFFYSAKGVLTFGRFRITMTMEDIRRSVSLWEE